MYMKDVSSPEGCLMTSPCPSTVEAIHIVSQAMRITYVSRRIVKILQVISRDISETIDENILWKSLHIYARSTEARRRWAASVLDRVIYDRRQDNGPIIRFGLFVTRVGDIAGGGYLGISLMLPPLWSFDELTRSPSHAAHAQLCLSGICLFFFSSRRKGFEAIYRPFKRRQNIAYMIRAGQTLIHSHDSLHG